MTVYTGLAIFLGVVAITMNLYIRIEGYRRRKRYER